MSSDDSRPATERSRLVPKMVDAAALRRSSASGFRPGRILIVIAAGVSFVALMSMGSSLVQKNNQSHLPPPASSIIAVERPQLHAGGGGGGGGKKSNSTTMKKLLDGCECTVLLIRHCEKGDLREDCSYLGFERSAYLATLFGPHDNEKWPVPSLLFAERPAGRNNPKKRNFREVETLRPTARKFNISIDTSYDIEHTSGLAAKLFKLMEEGQMCGKLAVISWKHSGIPHLASKLGCSETDGCPRDYPSKTFDQVWELKFLYTKKRRSKSTSDASQENAAWKVFGSVDNENFDPLSFSKQSGDYPEGGKAQGGSWDIKPPSKRAM